MSFYGGNISQLETESTFDPRTGESNTYGWKGTPAEVEIKRALYVALGYRVSVTPSDSGGYSILRVYAGGSETQDAGEALSNTWELDSNDSEKSLWLLPKVKAELDKLTVTNRVRFKSDVDALLRGEQKVTVAGVEVDLTSDSVILWAGQAGMDETIIEGLITSFASGVDFFPFSQTVLRREIVLASNSSVKASRLNVNKIFTTSELVSAESIPLDVKFELDDGFWLKRSPKCQRTSYGRWRISQEYYFADAYNEFSLNRQGT